ncbi:hypothetical protein FAF44_03250 [Nonomuraea sp. MG754425]|uniref:hypothetical protein n=1 Tax=Nonomuraea sp. MG754425 TaxID=2570319 RepID=UPI001F1FDB7D|nr:hypothetical protein [Nonomuraea sp. MG754425]MCF6467431.1 hypothetical protein [Nonomuraea sp. MG754425]
MSATPAAPPQPNAAETVPPTGPSAPPPLPEQETAGLADATAWSWDQLRNRSQRFRHTWPAHATAAAVYGGGHLLHALDAPGLYVVAGAAGAYGVTALVRAAVPKLKEKLASRWWWVAAGVWLPAAAEVGATGVMQTLMFAGAGLAVAPRIYRYRTRISLPNRPKRQALPCQQPAEKPHEEAPDPYVTRWNATTAKKNRGALPGSTLNDRTPFEYGGAHGIRYRLVLDGNITREAISARERVCGDFGVSIDEIQIEAPPDRRLNSAEVTFLNKLAVEDVQWWTKPGLNMETGVWEIGPFADGRGDAALRLWQPGSGPRPVTIIGAQRTGKSTLLRSAQCEFQGKPIRLLYGDPMNGQSCPELLPYLAKDAVGLDHLGIKALVERVHGEKERRSRLLATIEWTDRHGNKRRGVQSYDHPGAHGLDMLVLALDEFHALARDPELVEMVYDILAEGAKTGIVPWIIDQNAYVASFGGGELLGLLNAGNVVLLRNGDPYIAQATINQTMEVYPHMIEEVFPSGGDTAGCGYVKGATKRPVMMRIRDVDNMHAVLGGKPVAPIRWTPSDPAEAVTDEATSSVSTTDAAPHERGMDDISTDEMLPEGTPMLGDDADGLLDDPSDIGTLINFVNLTPAELNVAKSAILPLLDGAEQGLATHDLSMATGMQPMAVLLATRALEAEGRVKPVDDGDRYVLIRKAS